jgi:alpha-galactosidase
MQILDKQDGLRKYAGPNHWNDPDMMEVGNGMSLNEDRAHFSMWCMLAAPLIAGNDLTKMSDDVKNIFTNKDVIAIDQDKLGIQGFKYSTTDSIEIWFKPLENDDWAMCILNRDSKSKKISFDWTKEKVVDDIFNKSANFSTTKYQLKNLWTHKEIGITDKILSAEIQGHDVLMLRLIKKN